LATRSSLVSPTPSSHRIGRRHQPPRIGTRNRFPLLPLPLPPSSFPLRATLNPQPSSLHLPTLPLPSPRQPGIITTSPITKRLASCYAAGVQLHSPASRSARVGHQ
jgi:hypothetical protein